MAVTATAFSFSDFPMNPFVETMSVLQRRGRTKARVVRDAEPSIATLRASVPAPVLAHFDRLAALDRLGVAEVRNGVCGGCHLRLPAAVTAGRADDDDLQLCENCGAYLMFPTEEAPAAVPSARPRRRLRVVAVG